MVEVKEEIGLKEACKLLNVGKFTVMKYVNQGLIQYRNVSSPDSSRNKYKFLLADVLAIRNNYQVGQGIKKEQAVKPAHKRKYRYIDD